MKLYTRILAVLAITVWAGAANAALIYADRTTFENAVINELTDDFNTGYSFINDALVMKSLSVASIGYESTFHGAPNLNIVSGGALCWGCNGSGMIILDDTTIGTANGVYGFAIDILRNSVSLPYDAFVTFGDDSTQVFDLGIDGGFFGITSVLLIKSIHFTQASGEITGSGSFQIDNVTIGNSAASVPAPATLLLIMIGLFGLIGRAKFKKA